MTVRIRTALLMLVLSVLLPAVLAAVWLITQTYRSERQAVERGLRDGTRALSSVVDRVLDHRIQITRVLSASPALDDGMPMNAQRRRAFDADARAALGELDGWVTLDADDEHLVDTRWPPDAEPRPRGPQPAPLVDRITIGPPAGPATEPASVLHANVAQPVVRGGRVLFNVTLSIPAAELQRLVERQPLPPGWVSSVLDARGRLVARHPSGAAIVGRVAGGELLAIVQREREGLFQRVTIDGQLVSGYFSTSPQGWVYLTAMPQAQFDGPMPVAVWRVALGSLMLLLAAVVGALYVARGITRPMQSLKAAAQGMRARQPVPAKQTGIAECDAVQAALAGASQSLRQAHGELEAQVALAIEQTRGAEQRVARRQQVEALGRLTSGVAHDVNNLLGVVSNSAHLMQRKVDDERVHESLAATLRAVEAGSQLTRQLLRFARRHPSRPVVVDLAVQCAEWQDLMRVVLGRRIAFSMSVAPGTAHVMVDPAELELSLINLALNARDALPLGGQVWLQARNAGAEEWAPLPGAGVLIALSDDGAGMDEAVAAHAFEPFFSTKAPGQGTGLGLSQVQAFCEQAGGRARLGSTPGLGTTVSLLLPAARPARSADAAWPGQRSADSRLHGTRLLLVEDNEDLAAVTAALLASYGCQVLQARSAAQALALVELERPDVVLSDVVMPGEMDGLDMAHRLLQRFPDLPVVLISGYSSALATGQPFTVLRKPCPPDILVAALADAMATAAPP